ncbi:MAG: OmpA family protein [Bacteroidota bacterium]
MRYILTLFIATTFAPVLGQSIFSNFIAGPQDIGDKLFNEYAYTDAIEAYNKALKKEPENDTISLKIAESYRLLNDPSEASIWYEKVLSIKDSYNPVYFLHYAEALASTQRYDEAKNWYDYYGNLEQEDERAEYKINTIETRSKLFQNVLTTTVAKAPFNGNGADFSPAFYHDNIVFVSSRKSSSNIPIKFLWDNSEYLDLYIYNESGQVEKFDAKLNTKFHEGPLVFFENNTKVIFTRNNYYKGKIKSDNEGVTKLKLYMSEFGEGGWGVIQPLEFNNDDYSVGHPAITTDGKTLYFASDMPGGEGGTDLYKVTRVDDSWGEPENLGPNINTKGNEMFPFLHADKDLFFASNGHGGLGGLDIFGLDISEGLHSKISNVGSPINTNLDDFGIILKEDGLSGYFSSNREKSLNNDDIYTFNTAKPLLQNYMVKGVVADKVTRNVLPNTLIYLIRDGSVLSSTKSDDGGNYNFIVDPNTSYEIRAGGNGSDDNEKTYLPYVDELATVENEDNIWLKDIELVEDYGFELFIKVMDKSTGEPLADAELSVIDNINGDTIFSDKVNQRGEFWYSIENKELNDRISYQIGLAKEGYLGKSLVYNGALDTPGRTDISKALDLHLDKIEIGTDIGKLIDVQPIYFDLGKYSIRPDAAQELDKIVKIMLENPNIEIELGSHTDARGNSPGNLRLSDKRAKASADYIISQGIDKSRILGKGYGEFQIINRCVDGVKCSEKEHQLNRRTEFKVTSF